MAIIYHEKLMLLVREEVRKLTQIKLGVREGTNPPLPSHII